MTELRVCIDVEDLERGIAFYTRALGLRVGRRFGDDVAELLGAGVPVDLLAKPAGSMPSAGVTAGRDYGRHWTPVHLDVVVPVLEEAVQRARAAGATLEGDILEQDWGRLALMADPFGHGFCLLELKGRGDDALTGGGGGGQRASVKAPRARKT